MEEELAHEHMEHAEHAEHAVESGNTFLITVSATIAVLAVAAAIIASFESYETGTAIGEKNEAVLKQNQASDQWAYYQAKSLKQKMYEIAAAGEGPKAADFEKNAKRQEEESKEIQNKAQELEKERDEKIAEAEKHEAREHGLTFSATLVHVGIAIATISIITRGRRSPWLASIVLGLAGVVTAAWTYAH
jgi:cell division protein FtsN